MIDHKIKGKDKTIPKNIRVKLINAKTSLEFSEKVVDNFKIVKDETNITETTRL